MSTSLIVILSIAATLVSAAWARLMGESLRASISLGLLLGFVVPWGLGTFMWLAFGGRLA